MEHLTFVEPIRNEFNREGLNKDKRAIKVTQFNMSRLTYYLKTTISFNYTVH